MTSKELIIGHLENIPSKRCTVLAIYILFQYYGLDKMVTAQVLKEMYVDGLISYIEKDNFIENEIKLIPKLKLV